MTEKERRRARLDKLMEAYDIYVRVVQQGGDTAPAKKAAEAKARLEKDTDLMTRIRDVQADRKAREYLSLADNYFKAARFDSAREFCRRILAECPGTPQAFQAQILLDRMK
jgi:hypothetical protein